MLKFNDLDKGYDDLKKRAAELKDRKLTVGVHGKNDQRSEGATNVQIGTVHEYGATIMHPGGTPYMIMDGRAVFLPKGDTRATGVTKAHEITVPERSFLRATLDEKGPEYVKLCKKLSTLVLELKMTTDRALGLLGEKIKADIVQRINSGINPPLSAATIKAKGSSKPLVDTGSLKQSIDYVVKK